MISGGGEPLTDSSLVLSLSLLLLLAGFFLIIVAGVSIAHQELLNSPGVVPVLVEFRHTELDGTEGTTTSPTRRSQDKRRQSQ